MQIKNDSPSVVDCIAADRVRRTYFGVDRLDDLRMMKEYLVAPNNKKRIVTENHQNKLWENPGSAEMPNYLMLAVNTKGIKSFVRSEEILANDFELKLT